MTDFKLQTPVLFLIFNRPDTTQVVFETIRKAKPSRLFIAADGPRVDKPEEIERCNSARKVIEQVDWDCDVKTLFRETNLGCKIAVSSSIDWFFEHVDEGIILEDDCVPVPSFFKFCQELLEKYRADNRIFLISGNNFQFGKKRTDYSYYFSRYSHVWGWATWKRAWNYYDVGMKLWPKIQKGNWLNDIFGDIDAVNMWNQILNTVYSGELDTWDYQWTFSIWIQSGLCILPNMNMVSNIGCNQEATHTTDEQFLFANLPSFDIEFPLMHPPFIVRDAQADMATQKQNFQLAPPGILVRLFPNFMKLFHYILQFITAKSKKRYEHNQ